MSLISGKSGKPGVPDPCGAPDPCGVLDDDLGWALGAVLRGYRKFAAQVLREVPGGPRGYQALAAAGDRPATQLALAQRLGLDRTVMTYLLDDLEGAGLVERQPDPADRRARRITVTPAGERALGTFARRLGEVEDRVLAVLDPPDRETFRTLLQRLAAHVGAGCPEAAGHEMAFCAEDGDPECTTSTSRRDGGRNAR